MLAALLRGAVNFATGTGIGALRVAGISKAAPRGLGGYLGAGLGAGVGYGVYALGAGAVSAVRGLPRAVGTAAGTGAALARHTSPLVEGLGRATVGLARRSVVLERPAAQNLYTGIRLTGLGKTLALGGFAVYGAKQVFDAREQMAMGYIGAGVQPLPSLQAEGVPNRYDTGADGDLVFALNRLRHG
ncbi:MAG: hypothetical protein AB1330_01370 [Bacillota bacterium]